MNTLQRQIPPAAILGFSLMMAALLPSAAVAQDGDFDGLPDSLELSLAQWFFPILNLHCGTPGASKTTPPSGTYDVWSGPDVLSSHQRRSYESRT